MMRLGGCGAETACDSSLYFALHRDVEKAYPFDIRSISKQDYVRFAHIMEHYLWPRMSGIDRLEIYTDGYSKYLEDRGITEIKMSTLDGREPYEAAEAAVRRQIDAGYPVPTLILNHRDRIFADYNWHWFLINGYDDCRLYDVGRDDAMNGNNDMDTGILVKAVTYSSYEWLNLRRLWDTGYVRRGGLILYTMNTEIPARDETSADIK